MKILILHLSDIHLSAKSDEVLRYPKAIAQATFPFLSESGALFLAISGDIANTGLVDEYDLMRLFLDELKGEVSAQNSTIPIHVILSPGNHDCNFRSNQSIRNSVIDTVLRDQDHLVDESLIAACCAPQESYFRFQDQVTDKQYTIFCDPLLTQHSFQVGNKRVQFDCYNVSWLSKIRESSGALWFPFKRYVERFQTNDAIRIALLHHPFNWYAPGEHRELFGHLRNCATVVLTGHEHKSTGSLVFDVGDQARDTLFVEGGVLQDREGQAAPTFNLIELDVERATQRVSVQQVIQSADGAVRVSTRDADESSVRELPLPTKNGHRRRIRAEFMSQLLDAGAMFKHPSKDAPLTMDDVFVYPDLRYLDEEGDETERISSRLLERLTDGSTYVLVRGEEKSGKTSLAYRLFRSFTDQDLFPVYLDAASIRSAGAADLKKSLRRAAASQFGDGDVADIMKCEKHKRVLLLDGFDSIPVSEKYRKNVLAFFHVEFQHIFIFGNELMQASEILAREESLIQMYKQAALLKFGHRLRYELINRWNAIGDEQSAISDAEKLAKNDAMQKTVNSVVGKNFVPSVPIYLLTILQGIQIGRSSEIQQSGLGHYYNFLIVHALGSSGVKEQELDEHFSYLSELAFKLFSSSQREISETQFRDFNRWFSEFFTEVDLALRKDLLIRSKILTQHGDSIGFRYPYLYYYFLGRYLANNLTDLGIRAAVIRLCKTVFVTENANIVAFLAHHSRDPLITDHLVSLLDQLFPSSPEMKLSSDLVEFNRVVSDLPKLVYRKVDPEIFRQREHEKADQQQDDDKLAHASNETELSGIDMVGMMTLLFRLNEVLGQIIKGKYGSLRKDQKVQIIEKMYGATFRTMHALIGDMSSEPEALIGWITNWLREDYPTATEEHRKALAQRWAFGIIGGLASLMIRRTSEALVFEKLQEECYMAVQGKPFTSAKLLDISIKLSLPGNIPFQDLRSLAKDIKGNAVAERLLQMAVLRHLYMYKTSDIDKQKICEIAGLQVATQRGIDYKTKSFKLLDPPGKPNPSP